MQVVLISGLSGSGKSVALNVLEDNGYYCVDNLPVKLLAETVQLLRSAGQQRVAVSIDARGGQTVASLPAYLPSFFTSPLIRPNSLPAANLPTQIIAAPQLRWWEWRRWLVEAVANRHQPSGERQLRPMRQTTVRHPVGSFLAICTNARLHRNHPNNQPLLRIDFHSEAERMQDRKSTRLNSSHT